MMALATIAVWTGGRLLAGDAEITGVAIDTRKIKPGDLFWLCSDGIINHVDDDAIGETLRTKSPAEAAWSLVGQALVGGGSDNATVIVVRVDELEPI